MNHRLVFSVVMSLLLFGNSSGFAQSTIETTIDAGDLVLKFTRSDDGASLTSIVDKATGRELLAEDRAAFFECVLRKTGTQEDVSITSETGWTQVEIDAAEGDKPFAVRWSGAKNLGPEAAAIRVKASASLDSSKSRISWDLAVETGEDQKTWALRRVAFPQVALADLGAESELLFPSAAGEVKRNPCAKKANYAGLYPGGWSLSMQLMAYYGSDSQAKAVPGLYFSMHDPLGATKTISAKARSDGRSLVLKFDHPAEDMDRAGNGFSLSGRAVWQLLRGDWFDAAMIYREWVAEAEWYPQLAPEGRADTPQWMRELPVWIISGLDGKTGERWGLYGKAGGSPEAVMPDVERFAETVGVPVGFHWYNWHEIPFNDDYPHYFPAKPGFAEAVARLQEKDIYVMPYMNGRLWDSHDRGVEDFQFTSVALPAAAKDEAGQPFFETYRSKQADGETVRLAVMCPLTAIWQEKICETVLRLMNQCGTKGVYIDQVAAAKPVLCFDRSHGHPTGGGNWWVSGYRQGLEKIRKDMPSGHMITTECNAEPFIREFDGYLTWHWQSQDQQPVFPAVYGGSIQMFGRAYRGELNDDDLATRMKASQQLVYGEQIGWFHPRIIDQKENAAFIKQIIALRWHLRRYFYAGRMARPPKPLGEIPIVRADWRWKPDWWVEHPAVYTGAWRLPDENKVVFFAVNVSSRPITCRAALDLADYGLKGEEMQATHLAVDETMNITKTSSTVPRRPDHPLTIPEKTAWAWEVHDRGQHHQ